jgi:GH25 family lysozyme M1 (1,4-beta-N-acetylmuramidase)
MALAMGAALPFTAPAHAAADSPADKYPIRGVDVTHYQHPNNAAVDWARVAGSGVRFATLKATESTTYTDPWFARDIAAARAAGIPVTPYHFYIARSPNTGAAQADYFISVVRATGYTGHRPGDLPPVFDFEWDWKTGECPAYGTIADARSWLDRVQAAFGVKPIIYTARGFMTSCMGSSTALSSYLLQIADYVDGHTSPALPPGWNTWLMWQYTNTGSIPGIPTTNVTRNVFNGTQAQLDALANRSSESPAAAPVTGSNADGRSQVFAIGGNGALYTKWQTTPNGIWGDWKNLGGTDLRSIAVDRNADGRLQAFAVGGNGALYSTWQLAANGDWGDWKSLGGTDLRSIAVDRNADGRLQAFAVGGNGALYSTWQLAANGDWGDWKSLGGTGLQSIATGRNADGRLQAFAVGGNGALYSTWQLTANGDWGDWKSHGGTGLRSIAVDRNADGRLQAFAVGGNGALYSTWQLAANGDWGDWKNLGGTGLQSIATGRNADGRLQVFAIGGNGALYSTWQLTANGNWADWNSMDGQDLTPRITTGSNADGRLQVFAVGGNGALYSRWQLTANGNWGDWNSFGGTDL